MKSTLEKTGTLSRKLNIQVPAEVVKSAFDKTFKQIQKDAHIKGFRPGKAPIATIKSVYGGKATQDVVERVVQTNYFKALQEHSLDPISYPTFELDTLKNGQQVGPEINEDFSFSALFEVKPDVQLKKYEGLEVEKEKITIGDEQVTQVLENIRASKADLVAVLEDRPAQLGDVAVVNFEGFVDGAPLENGAGTDHHLELGANQFIEGFEDGVVGMKIGSEKTLNLKFPDPYHAAQLAGKPVQFKVKLTGLKKKALPELNDEFLKSIGSNDTLEGLKKTIREDLQKTEEKKVETDFRNNLLKKLVEANPVEVPASMLEEQKQALVEDFKKRMTEQGMTEQDFQAYREKWDKDFATTASEMIQSGFLVDALAKKYTLTATEEDLSKKYAEYAAQTGIDETRIREFYSKPEQTQRLSYQITEDKVLEFLTSKAKVKEVTKAAKK